MLHVPEIKPDFNQLQAGINRILTANAAQAGNVKILTLFSKGVLTNEGQLQNQALAGLSAEVASKLNHAKALMNLLGVTDVTKAPAITINQARLTVKPGQLQGGTSVGPRPFLAAAPVRTEAAVAAGPAVAAAPRLAADLRLVEPLRAPIAGLAPEMGFMPVTWLVNEAVIIASTLDLTQTQLMIDPSVSTLTIIVETLTCGPGAQISFDDSAVWHPQPLPQTTAQAGNSYNQSNHPGGQDNGPSGGPGQDGQAGSPQTIAPPAAPSVDIFALNVTGMPAMHLQGLQGAPGNPGQNGGSGGNGAKGINGTDFAVLGAGVCIKTPGNGGEGGRGGNGGNAGNGGQGGAGGSFMIATTQDVWNTLIGQTWNIQPGGGSGGIPGLPGRGGAGGAGGYPGDPSPGGACSKANGGANGAPGAAGRPGVEGPAGSGGLINPTIITAEEWYEELTKPWLETLNPSQGPPGTAVTAVGLNIEAGDLVTVNGQNVAATSPAAGQLHFSLPNPLAGGTASVAIRRASDGLESNAMNFSVQPLIAGSSANGGYTPGDTIQLQGAAFLKNASVHFTPAGQPEQVIVAQNVAADGTSLSFLVPGAGAAAVQAAGTATVMVGNPDGQKSNQLSITRLSFVANGFLPDPNGFAFQNFSPGTPDWGTFGDDFGSVEVGLSALAAPVLTGAYFAAYMLFLGKYCTGLCTGFSLAAMKRYLDGETRAVDESVNPTPALTREFTVDMGRLLSGQLLATFLEQCANGLPQAQKTLEQIEAAFTNGATRDTMPILFFIPAGLPVSSQWFDNLNASHCIVPYKITRPAGWHGGYDGVKLYIYDCNHPKDSSCCLTFQQRGNTLAFSYSADPTVSSDKGWTLGVLTMDQALYNGVDLPWVAGIGAAMEFVVDVILSPATLAISNLAGQTSGIRGGNIVAEVPGVIPSLQRMQNLVMVPRQMALQRTIQGTGAGTYTYASSAPPDPALAANALNGLRPAGQPTARVVAGARGLTLQNVSCTATTRDVVLLGPNNHSVQISTNEAGKTFDAVIAHQYALETGVAPNVQRSAQMQTVTLKGLSVAPGEQLLVWSDAVLGQFGVSNPGTAKNFTVVVANTDLASGKITATQTVPGAVAAQGDFAATVADWTQLNAAPATQQGGLRGLLPAGFVMPTVE